MVLARSSPTGQTHPPTCWCSGPMSERSQAALRMVWGLSGQVRNQIVEPPDGGKTRGDDLVHRIRPASRAPRSARRRAWRPSVPRHRASRRPGWSALCRRAVGHRARPLLSGTRRGQYNGCTSNPRYGDRASLATCTRSGTRRHDATSVLPSVSGRRDRPSRPGTPGISKKSSTVGLMSTVDTSDVTSDAGTVPGAQISTGT